jgi:hypothetical protein
VGFGFCVSGEEGIGVDIEVDPEPAIDLDSESVVCVVCVADPAGNNVTAMTSAVTTPAATNQNGRRTPRTKEPTRRRSSRDGSSIRTVDNHLRQDVCAPSASPTHSLSEPLSDEFDDPTVMPCAGARGEPAGAIAATATREGTEDDEPSAVGNATGIGSAQSNSRSSRAAGNSGDLGTSVTHRDS